MGEAHVAEAVGAVLVLNDLVGESRAPGVRTAIGVLSASTMWHAQQAALGEVAGVTRLACSVEAAVPQTLQQVNFKGLHWSQANEAAGQKGHPDFAGRTA